MQTWYSTFGNHDIVIAGENSLAHITLGFTQIRYKNLHYTFERASNLGHM